MKSVEQAMLKLYGGNYTQYGDTPRTLLHNDHESQHERFTLIHPLFGREQGPFTVHEIGPALGHYGDYLKEYAPQAHFSGSEIFPPFVEICHERFPGHEFYLRNILEEVPSDRYDFVVLIGTFNIPGESLPDEWQTFVYDMLRAMYSLCRKGIGATFLTSYYDPGRNRPDLHYQDERELMDFTVRNLSRHFEIDEMGPLYEYALRVYRPEYIHSLYPQPAFARYFKPK